MFEYLLIEMQYTYHMSSRGTTTFWTLTRVSAAVQFYVICPFEQCKYIDACDQTFERVDLLIVEGCVREASRTCATESYMYVTTSRAILSSS